MRRENDNFKSSNTESESCENDWNSDSQFGALSVKCPLHLGFFLYIDPSRLVHRFSVICNPENVSVFKIEIRIYMFSFK